MNDECVAAVPRHLRVRGTVQWGTTRLPLRLFCTLVATAAVGAGLLVAGMELRQLLSLLLPFAGTLALLLEGRWAGRSLPRLVANLARDHFRHRYWRYPAAHAVVYASLQQQLRPAVASGREVDHD